MKNLVVVLLVVILGVVLGSAAALGLRGQKPPAQVVASPAATPAPRVQTSPSRSRQVLLVWTPGRLPQGFAESVADIPKVHGVSVVHAGRIDLRQSRTAQGRQVDAFRAGWSVPLDVFAVDRDSYRKMLPTSVRAAFADLGPKTALLGETSARLRRLDVGDELVLSPGGPMTVAGVVPDTLIGAAEVVVTAAAGRRLGVRTPKFMLVEISGDRPRVEAAIRRRLPTNNNVRVRGPDEVPYLRHGDAVLPQSLLKELFGEFSYKHGSGRDFVQDPRWEAENIVRRKVPILGVVRCHRALLPALEGAMAEVREEGLAHLVNSEEYQGCWNPRLITEGGDLSRHAWGVAVDLNATANPTGAGSGQDPRLVDIMQRWGFTWGGFWLIPDPMHFEYVGTG